MESSSGTNGVKPDPRSGFPALSSSETPTTFLELSLSSSESNLTLLPGELFFRDASSTCLFLSEAGAGLFLFLLVACF